MIYIYITDQDSNSESLNHIESFKTFVENNKNLFDLEKIDQTRSVPLDVTNLTNDQEFISSWPTFNTELFEYPDKTLRLLEYCLHEVILFFICCFDIVIYSPTCKQLLLTLHTPQWCTILICYHYVFQTLKFESKIKIRILNHQPVIPLANLKVNYFGKYSNL